MRSLTAYPFTGINTRPFRPGDEIRAASADAAAHWQALARAYNLALEQCAAGPVIADGWADGQFDVDHMSATLEVSYRIPPAPSDHHANLYARLEGAGPTTNGRAMVEVAIYGYSDSMAGATVLISPANHLAGLGMATTLAIPAGDTPAWHVAEVPVLTTPGHEQLDIAVLGQLHVITIAAEWISPASTDGAGGLVLPAGQVADGVATLDVDEVAEGEPVAADVVDVVARGIEHAHDRAVTLLTAAAPASVGYLPDSEPIRRRVHVPYGGATVYLHARVKSVDGRIHVQAGNGDADAIVREGRAVSIYEPGDVEGWVTWTVDLPANRTGGAPEDVPGFTHFAVMPDTLELESISAWMVPKRLA